MATQTSPEPAEQSPEGAPEEPTTVPADAQPADPQPAVEQPADAQPIASQPTELQPTEPLGADAPPAESVAAPAPTVVFVQAPQPPKKRGARGVGALVALLSAGIFAAVYALLVLLIALIGSPQGLAPALRFLSTVTFWVPVVVFLFSYLLLIVVVNRAGWWAHVLGGFIVAVLVWIGFVGSAIIAAGAFGGPASEVGAVVLQQLSNPLGFAAAIAAREVPIWVGGLVAKRGRTARARNAAARAAYEQELAEHRTTIGAPTAV
ncbi:hypothetical protein [Microcella humidisoli]|uniref:Uncharacterized protein n=1 Tax=Microcella humidisoli TaxID=2963406 RepID=A0ABY5FST1_9MICO|nr:hypothetical protein [Microcella humidisoli]UTT61351.1 hypothetical protein NNL39_06530 [Microcella humidisoli]